MWEVSLNIKYVFNALDFKNSTSNFYLEFDLVEELHLFSDMLKRVE